jgi:hypothetical protein
MPRKKDSNHLFIGSLISSLITAILVLAEDFGGWYSYYSYAEQWAHVGFSFDRPLSLLLFGVAAGVLLFCSYVSYLKLASKPIPKDWLQKAFLGSAGVTVAAVLGGLYFIVDMTLSDPTDWWLGTAFYAGVIGGGLTAVFLHLALKNVKK